jgi:quercetin dioxygenase-like cupin family protein
MVEEARLEEVGSGLAPATDGWFVVNAAEAAWVHNDALGNRCTFESSPRVLAERPDLEPHMFSDVGYTLTVIEPGKPSGMYHAESLQEDFLVLSGECVLLIEGEERRLRAWDFVHCPGRTQHIFIGAGDAPCARARRRRRDGDELTGGGLRPAPTLAPRPPEDVEPAPLGIELGARQTCTNLRAGV